MGLAAPGFQLLPAPQLLEEQAVDLVVSALVLAQGVRWLAVVVGAGHLPGERFVLGFQRFDVLWQRFELAGFFVGELGARLRNPPLPPRRRGSLPP